MNSKKTRRSYFPTQLVTGHQVRRTTTDECEYFPVFGLDGEITGLMSPFVGGLLRTALGQSKELEDLHVKARLRDLHVFDHRHCIDSHKETSLPFDFNMRCTSLSVRQMRSRALPGHTERDVQRRV